MSGSDRNDEAPTDFATLPANVRQMLARMEPFEVTALVFFLQGAKASRWLACTTLAIAAALGVAAGAYTAIRSLLK